MNFKPILIGAGVFALALPSFAGFQSVGPFTGTEQDLFEDSPDYDNGGNYSFLQSADGFFNISSNPGNLLDLWIYNPGAGATWGLGSNGQAIVNSGNQALGLYNGSTNPIVTLTFAAPVAEFGGYFASDSTTGHNYLTFFDQNGALIQQTDIYTTGNAMLWNGWQGTGGTLISEVQFSGSFAPVMDDLQANPAPEPITVAFLGLGALGLLRRRRNN